MDKYFFKALRIISLWTSIAVTCFIALIMAIDMFGVFVPFVMMTLFGLIMSSMQLADEMRSKEQPK